MTFTGNSIAVQLPVGFGQLDIYTLSSFKRGRQLLSEAFSYRVTLSAGCWKLLPSLSLGFRAVIGSNVNSFRQ